MCAPSQLVAGVDDRKIHLSVVWCQVSRREMLRAGPPTWDRLSARGCRLLLDLCYSSLQEDIMQVEPTISHGTLYGYAGQGCRCPECKEASLQYGQKYRSTETGRDASRRSASRNNFIRQKALEFVRRERPDMIAIFELQWREMLDDKNINQ